MSIVPAEWPLDKSLRAVKAQLERLQELKPLDFRSGQTGMEGWRQITQNVFAHSFSSASGNIDYLEKAKRAGGMSLDTMSDSDRQRKYQKQLQAYETCLKTAIDDLRMSLPEEEIKGVYEGGDQYAFCRDLRKLIQHATKDVLIIDPYLDPTLFGLYVDDLDRSVGICVLTSRPKENVKSFAQMFATGRPHFEMRTHPDLHDRVVFADDRCWVIGQSIKDAAKSKTTYIVEFSHALMRPVYDDIWDSATSQVKG